MSEMATQNPQQPSAASIPNQPGGSLSSDRQAAVDAEHTIQKSAITAAANSHRRSGTPLASLIANYKPPTVDDAAIAKRLHDEEVRKARNISSVLCAASGVPERYSLAGEWSADALPAEIRTAAAEKMATLRRASKPGAILGLIGPRGTGKTFFACALVIESCQAGRPAFYRDAMDYLLALRGTYGDRATGKESSVEAEHVKPDLLVLDEMHERGETPWEDRMLTRLINKRYAANKVTVLISNQDEKTFSERVGESIASRIEDGGGLIMCDWASVRGRINNQ